MRYSVCLSVILIACTAGGCAYIVEGMVQGALNATFDRVFETRDDRHIRKDLDRHRRGKDLKYHRDARDLRRHRHQRQLERERGEALFDSGDY